MVAPECSLSSFFRLRNGESKTGLGSAFLVDRGCEVDFRFFAILLNAERWLDRGIALHPQHFYKV